MGQESGASGAPFSDGAGANLEKINWHGTGG